MTTLVTHCTFAMSGTYGHECGKPATLVMSHPSKLTADGVYHAGRCAECSKIRGGENAGYTPAVPLAGHVNTWPIRGGCLNESR